MIFQHTWERVLSGDKKQTRRIVKPGDEAVHGTIPYGDPKFMYGQTVIKGVQRNGRTLWQVGNTYAVQPARTKKGIARIQITGIRREDVREIHHLDAVAEAIDRVAPKHHFLKTWCRMHDKTAAEIFSVATRNDPDPLERPNHCPQFLWDRPAELYQAWVLEFKLVEEN